MLIFDFMAIGDRLHKIRKFRGMTQAEVAENAELSDRTYADIERGSVNMRVETLLKICKSLNITPNEVLITEEQEDYLESELMESINRCSKSEKRTALKLLGVYLDSINKYSD